MTTKEDAFRIALVETLVIRPTSSGEVEKLLLGDDVQRHITDKRWLAANRKLLQEIGEEQYLRRVRAVLKGVDPVSELEAPSEQL